MKSLNLVTLALVIVGGINWLLVGVFQVDLVASIFGGSNRALARIVYCLVGLSALWQIMPLIKAASDDSLHAEERAQRGM